MSQYLKCSYCHTYFDPSDIEHDCLVEAAQNRQDNLLARMTPKDFEGMYQQHALAEAELVIQGYHCYHEVSVREALSDFVVTGEERQGYVTQLALIRDGSCPECWLEDLEE